MKQEKLLLKLLEYPRANAAIRVKILLNLKNVPYEVVTGEHSELDTTEFRAINPQAMVPVLIAGTRPIWQSMAIAEYLEETFPDPPLLPTDPWQRSRVRSLALILACDGQPLANMRVRDALGVRWGFTEDQVTEWSRHWLELTLTEYEAALALGSPPGAFSHGDAPTLADAFLFATVLLAQRFGFPVDGLPNISRVVTSCWRLDAFNLAAR